MSKHVFIVLASFNGIEYIGEQLDSLLSQSWPCVIHIFDDGSTDGTVEMIRAKYLKYDNIHLTVNTHKLGFAHNFEQGIRYAYDAGADLIALSDQDDLWTPDRLKRMCTDVLQEAQTIPLLAYSDLSMISGSGRPLHPSYFGYRGYTNRTSNALATALGQNGVMGNTILMNRRLAELSLPFPPKLHAHDYWISLLAELYGKCLFIPEPLVHYRIHTHNTSNSLRSLNNLAKESLWRRVIDRNYRLPYKEDSRALLIEHVLDQVAIERPSNKVTQPLSEDNQALLRGFLHYLNFDKPRWYLAYWMLKNQFIKKKLKYKTRFLYRILTTRRYSKR